MIREEMSKAIDEDTRIRRPQPALIEAPNNNKALAKPVVILVCTSVGIRDFPSFFLPAYFLWLVTLHGKLTSAFVTFLL